MSERWKPELGETYYFMDFVGAVGDYEWRGDSMDCSYYKLGNCFKTKEEAEAAAGKVKDLLLSLHYNGTSTANSETLKGTFTEYLKKCAEIQADMILQKARERRLSEQYHNAPEKNKLPDWCKVGEWVYAICLESGTGDFFKIREIRTEADIILKVGEGETDWLLFGNHIFPARLRPYNAEEMKALMGKVIKEGPNMDIVTGFENVFDNECMVHVNGCLYGANDLLRRFTFDNAPCGVFEHLENGKWVK